MDQIDAWLQPGATSDETREAYKYFMRPEPHGEMGPIEQDPETGRRFRLISVGMTRNAKDENRKERRVWLDPLPHILLDDAKPLQGWYKAKHEPSRVRARPCFTEAILTEPYGGYCAVGCAFCYVNAGVRGYRGTGLISVPKDYGAFVRKSLARMRTSAAGYFSSFTDPFLPLEDVYHNTEEGARAFVDAGLPIFFLSRLRYPGWAFDLLRKNPHSYAQKSINTPHAEDWKKLSPGALDLDGHLDEIRELRKQGIYVSIQCNPVVPGVVTHDDVEFLFQRLAEAGANHVIVKFVEAGFSWAPEMVNRIRKRFGMERAREFERLFTENIGGQRTIVEDYRMEGHHRYRAAATRLGMTYATCYEYAYGRDEEGKVVNKVGHSVGLKFLTADQCHGHRVPMYARASTADPFRPLDECPPSGCLTCGELSGGEDKVPCGSPELGAAGAMKAKDHFRGIPILSEGRPG